MDWLEAARSSGASDLRPRTGVAPRAFDDPLESRRRTVLPAPPTTAPRPRLPGLRLCIVPDSRVFARRRGCLAAAGLALLACCLAASGLSIHQLDFPEPSFCTRTNRLWSDRLCRIEFCKKGTNYDFKYTGKRKIWWTSKRSIKTHLVWNTKQENFAINKSKLWLAITYFQI